MKNVIILDLQNKIDVKLFNAFAKKNKEVAKFYFFASKKSAVKKEFDFFVVEETNEDKILNSGIDMVDKNDLVIVRNVENNDFSLLQQMLEKNVDCNGVCCTQNKRNKISAFFASLFEKIVLFMFGYKIMSNNLSVVLLGENYVNTIKHFENASFFTKITNFAGCNIEFLDIESKSKIKFKADNKKHIISLICNFIFCVCGVLVLCFVPLISKIFILFLVCLLVVFLCGIMFVLNIFQIYLKRKIGTSEFGKVEIIKGGKNGKN